MNRLSGCKKIPGLSRAHFELRKGTEQEASTYCKKEGDFWERGQQAAKGPGSRTDVTAFQQKLKEGLTDLELMEVDFNAFNRFSKTIDRYRSLCNPKRTEDLTVHLFIGAPGTGKTRMAYALQPDLYAFPIGKDLWSDGYAGQKEVLVDDFSGQMRLVDTLRFLDRYPVQIPKKGGFNWWIPTTIIITTNIQPWDWYDWTKRPTQQAALRRRIHFIWNFDDKTHGPNSNQPRMHRGEAAIQLYWPII